VSICGTGRNEFLSYSRQASRNAAFCVSEKAMTDSPHAGSIQVRGFPRWESYPRSKTASGFYRYLSILLCNYSLAPNHAHILVHRSILEIDNIWEHENWRARAQWVRTSTDADQLQAVSRWPIVQESQRVRQGIFSIPTSVWVPEPVQYHVSQVLYFCCKIQSV
jgi:hypothetical protein